MKNYLIPEELVVGVLRYLGGRPYIEVADMIRALRVLHPELSAQHNDISTTESGPPGNGA